MIYSVFHSIVCQICLFQLEFQRDNNGKTDTLLLLASVFCAAVEGEVGTHYYVSKAMNWNDAQTHCRKYYTDLSCVNDQKDMEKILKATERQASPEWNMAWIGLYRDPSNATLWKWSGGGYVTYTNWATGQPDNYFNRENRGTIYRSGKCILSTLRSDASLHSSSEFVVFSFFV
uniref:C-type lectin domain-containing protein n=1 Tax=Salarias fasciatus TaxID=181472 RepID=A0A672GAD1_SALFA